MCGAECDVAGGVRGSGIVAPTKGAGEDVGIRPPEPARTCAGTVDGTTDRDGDMGATRPEPDEGRPTRGDKRATASGTERDGDEGAAPPDPDPGGPGRGGTGATASRLGRTKSPRGVIARGEPGLEGTRRRGGQG